MNEQECAMVCKSLQEYVRVCKSMQRVSKSIHSMQEYAREYNISFRALIFLEGERCNKAVSRRMHKENATVDKRILK